MTSFHCLNRASNGLSSPMGNGSDDDRARILRSADGLHRTTNSVAPGNNLSRVVRLPDRFVALGDDGNFWSSETGENWVSVAAASDINLQGIAEGGGRLVAVGDDNQALKVRPKVPTAEGIMWSR